MRPEIILISIGSIMAPSRRSLSTQEDLEPGDNEVHPDEDLHFESDGDLNEENERQRRKGIKGRTDNCRSILEKLSMGQIAERIELLIQEMRKVDFDLATLIYYITALQGDEADTSKIK